MGLLAVSRTMKEEEEVQTLAALEATPPLELQERPARATHSNAENAIEEALADLVMAMMVRYTHNVVRFKLSISSLFILF